jgi:hypothetical protein
VSPLDNGKLHCCSKDVYSHNHKSLHSPHSIWGGRPAAGLAEYQPPNARSPSPVLFEFKCTIPSAMETVPIKYPRRLLSQSLAPI